jgi:hypothetical protein
MPTELLEVPSQSGADRRRALVVVGMHRSGTSAMARTLSLLGGVLPTQLIAPHEDNETGFWEPWPIALLNDEILEALDSEWDDVFAFRPKLYLSNFDRVYLGRAVDLLEQEFNGSELIVLKDPRISVLTAFWDRALREAGYTPHYIVMVRNPLEVAESLRARNGFPREKSLLLWSSYMIAIDRDTRKHPRTFVSYDQLTGDWRSTRRRIEAGTSVPFPRDTAAAAIEIDRFLDPRMRHHAAGSKDLFSSADVPERVKTLYRIFSEACEGKDVDIAALRAIETEMEELDVLVGPLLADLRGSARALSSKVTELTDANARVREQVGLLEGQLAAERELREAEAAASSLSNADYETRLAELVERIAAAEVERDSLAVDAQDKARAAADLAERLAAMETQLADKQAELTATRELVSSANAEVAANENALAQRLEELARLTEQLHEYERQIEHLKHLKRDGEEARRKVEVAARENERKLAQQFQEVAKLTKLLDESKREIDVIERDAEEARKQAEAVAKENEGKLAQRFQETATLTKLLKQQEERGERADEQLGWLLALHARLGKQSRWWAFMPKSWQRRWTHIRLQDAGLFDGDAYLRRYPDVAAEGMDPLDHFLRHGLVEGRTRKF